MNEQPIMSAHTSTYLSLTERDIDKWSKNLNDEVLKILSDRVDEMLINSNILTDPKNTILISEDSLPALGFTHRQVLKSSDGLAWCWVKNGVQVFPYLEGWKVGVGVPAILADTVLESLVDLNTYYRITQGTDIIVKP